MTVALSPGPFRDRLHAIESHSNHGNYTKAWRSLSDAVGFVRNHYGPNREYDALISTMSYVLGGALDELSYERQQKGKVDTVVRDKAVAEVDAIAAFVAEELSEEDADMKPELEDMRDEIPVNVFKNPPNETGPWWSGDSDSKIWYDLNSGALRLVGQVDEKRDTVSSVIPCYWDSEKQSVEPIHVTKEQNRALLAYVAWAANNPMERYKDSLDP